MTKMWVEDESGRPYAVKKADLGGGGGGGSAATPEQMANGNATAPTITPQAGSDNKLLQDINTKLGGTLTTSGSAPGTVTDVGGAITTGGTAQQIAPATPGGHVVAFRNTSAGELRVTDNGADPSATVGDRVLPNGGWLTTGYPQAITNPVKVWGASTGQTFTASRRA